MKTDNIEYLKNTFPDQISLSEVERLIYSHDVGEMPLFIRPLLGDVLADAVFKPESEKDLEKLVYWARDNKVPLTPRGKATSGYGGVIPAEKGIIVDFYNMRDLISIDSEKMTVTVQPGISWEELDIKLAEHSFTLRLYPTSYMSSTVGGWVAHNGAGIGSFEYGWFRDNIHSVKLLRPDGIVVFLQGSELDLVCGAFGVTGLIIEVCLRVQPLVELDIRALEFTDSESMQSFFTSIISDELPLWSVSFVNPEMNVLKKKVSDYSSLLADSFVCLLAFNKKYSSAVSEYINASSERIKLNILSKETAEHEWKNRFKVMQIKPLGPSLIPAEVVLPLEKVSDFFIRVKEKIAPSVVKEGIVIKNGRQGKAEAVILGFIPCDMRKFNSHLLYSLSLSILKIAENLGGRAYSTGLYFTSKAGSVLGDDVVRDIRKLKRLYDPDNILNPGKVYSSSLINVTINVAAKFEPVSRLLGNIVKYRTSKDKQKERKFIPADIIWNAYSCSQCGNCVNSCDQFYGRGWESHSPRGKWYWLRQYLEGKTEWSQEMVDTFLVCTTCEICNDRCSANLPVESSWMKLRGRLINDRSKMTLPPFEMMAASLKSQGNIWGGYRSTRTDWISDDMQDFINGNKSAEAVYFSGCTASYIEKDIAVATAFLLRKANINFSHLGNRENCCGTPMLVAGKWDLFAENMQYNIKLVKESGADTVISSCPACDMMWRHVYPEWAEKLGIEYNIKAKHYTEVLSEKIKKGELIIPDSAMERVRVTWHDSCHAGRVSGLYDPPRDLIKANPRAEFSEMSSHRENAKCCGSVLTLMKDPEVAHNIGKTRIEEAVDVNAAKILALCPCCQFQLRVSAIKKDLPVEVVDLARFTAESFGVNLPDPVHAVKKQWVFFEKMIPLMSVAGFSDILTSVIREHYFKSNNMLLFIKLVNSFKIIFRPLVIFSIKRLLVFLIPGMIPHIINNFKQRVKLPDYLEEQMDDLFPEVIGNILPHIKDEVIPVVVDNILDIAGKRG